MKIRIFVIISFTLMIFSLSGCGGILYMDNFKDIPIYPGTQILFSGEVGEKYQESYINFNFKEKFEDVINFYEENINKNIWTITQTEDPRGSMDKGKQYILSNENQKVLLILMYSESEKENKETITIVAYGDILK